MRISKNTTFVAGYADANVVWRVIEKVGKNAWLCQSSHDEWDELERVFTTRQIDQYSRVQHMTISACSYPVLFEFFSRSQIEQLIDKCIDSLKNEIIGLVKTGTKVCPDINDFDENDVCKEIADFVMGHNTPFTEPEQASEALSELQDAMFLWYRLNAHAFFHENMKVSSRSR